MLCIDQYGIIPNVFFQRSLNQPIKQRFFIDNILIFASAKFATKLPFVCVTEQHYVSIFFTRFWSVRKPRLFDTENPEIFRILNCACI